MAQTPVPAHPDLLTEIERFCAARGMSLTGFGIRALGDPRFVHDLRQGRECRRRTIDAVERFMASSDDGRGPAATVAAAP